MTVPRYRLEHDPTNEQPWAVIDTQEEVSVGDKGGMVIADCYQERHAKLIVERLNDALAAKLAEVERERDCCAKQLCEDEQLYRDRAQLQHRLATLTVALESIAEYWNGVETESAAVDACRHNVGVAQTVLEKKESL